MREAGLDIPSGYYQQADGDYSFASGLLAAQKLLAQNPRPTAVFCISDILALSTISAAQEAGLSVPGTLTVTGFDDVDYTTMFHPFLTTVAQPCYEMGRKRLELLLALLGSGAARSSERSFVPYRLVERESSAPYAEGL